MSSNLEQIGMEIAGLTDKGEQSAALYHLYARIASGIENNEEGTGKIFISMAEAWNEAAIRIDNTAKENPDLAFEQALNLCLVPKNPDPKREKVLRWMRGDGPTILAKESLRQPLIKFIKSDPRAPKFFAKLQENMKYDITGLTQDQAFTDAECYLAVSSMYFGAKLSGVKHQDSLTAFSNTAREKLSDPKIAKVVNFYKNEADTAWLPTELEAFLPH